MYPQRRRGSRALLIIVALALAVLFTVTDWAPRLFHISPGGSVTLSTAPSAGRPGGS
jgi:hypothetical protein